MPNFDEKLIADLDEAFLSSGWSLIREQVVLARVEGAAGQDRSDMQLVSEQKIKIRKDSWSHTEILGDAAKEFEDKGNITRGDIIANFTNENSSDREKLAWAFMFGYGKVGYGPSRLEAVLREERLDDRLARVRDLLHLTGPMVAYAEMLDLIPGLGPAFFTKYLYFEHAAKGPGDNPHALILDQVLASKMSAIACRAGHKAGIPQSHELANWLWKGPAWSRFRYACYLQFMNSQKDMQPDLLELLLFNLELEL
jgi:hypothetical protein